MPFLLEHSAPEDAARLCAGLGLSFVELHMSFPACRAEALDADALNQLRASYGIYFTLHLDEGFNPCDFNLAVRAAYMQTALRAIALAREIDAPVINMHWARGVYITLPDARAYLNDMHFDAYRAAALAFRDACDKALRRSRTRLCIENTNGFLPFETRVLDDLLRCPAFGLTLDIGHCHAAGEADLPF